MTEPDKAVERLTELAGRWEHSLWNVNDLFEDIRSVLSQLAAAKQRIADLEAQLSDCKADNAAIHFLCKGYEAQLAEPTKGRSE